MSELEFNFLYRNLNLIPKSELFPALAVASIDHFDMHFPELWVSAKHYPEIVLLSVCEKKSLSWDHVG